MSLDLPAVVETYFAAAGAGDPDRVAACFTETGLVHDEGRDIRGRDAVRAWVVETRRKYSFQVQVLTAEATADGLLATGHVTGDFPGSPVDLGFRFTLEGGKIAALEIG